MGTGSVDAGYCSGYPLCRRCLSPFSGGDTGAPWNIGGSRAVTTSKSVTIWFAHDAHSQGGSMASSFRKKATCWTMWRRSLITPYLPTSYNDSF